MAFISGSNLKLSRIAEFSQLALLSFFFPDVSVDEKQMPRKILGIAICVSLAYIGNQSPK